MAFAVLAAFDTTGLLVALLGGGLAAAIVSWLRLKAETPGLREQATARRVDYMGKIVDELEKANKRLGAENAELRGEVVELRARLDALEAV